MVIELVVDMSKDDELICKSYKLYREYKNWAKGRYHKRMHVFFRALPELADMEKRADTADISVLFFLWLC